jgi:hypothetical protein
MNTMVGSNVGGGTPATKYLRLEKDAWAGSMDPLILMLVLIAVPIWLGPIVSL